MGVALCWHRDAFLHLPSRLIPHTLFSSSSVSTTPNVTIRRRARTNALPSHFLTLVTSILENGEPAGSPRHYPNVQSVMLTLCRELYLDSHRRCDRLEKRRERRNQHTPRFSLASS